MQTDLARDRLKVADVAVGVLALLHAEDESPLLDDRGCGVKVVECGDDDCSGVVDCGDVIPLLKDDSIISNALP